MVEDTLLLLRNYWTIDRREESRYSRWVGLLLRGVGVVAMVAFSALMGYGAGTVVSSPELPFTVRLGTLPGLLLTMVMLVTLVVGINQSLTALYLTNDMELLFSAPLRSESILAAKLLSRLPLTITVALILTIPALVVYGVVAGLGPAFYLGGVAALLSAPLFGLAAGALLSMLIVRVLPAERVAEYVGAASIILGVAFSILIQLPRFLSGGEGPSAGDLAAANTAVSGLEALPLPPMWAGHALVDLAQGRPASGLAGLLPFFLLTAGFFAVVLLLANRLYLDSWLRMQASGGSRGRYSADAGLFGAGKVEVGIGFKDWLLRTRDARQLASLASGLIFAVFFGFLMVRPGGSGDVLADLPQDQPMARLISPGVLLAGALLYVGWATFSQTATAVLSLEGRSLYLLRAAPVDARTVYRSKVLSLFTPYGVFMGVALLIGWFFLRFNPAWGLYAWLCLLLIGYGMLSMSTALGFAYPRLDWDDPRRMSSSQAGWRSLLFNVPYGLLSLLLAAAPFAVANFWLMWTLPAVLLGLALLGGMSWGVSLWGARKARATWTALEAG